MLLWFWINKHYKFLRNCFRSKHFCTKLTNLPTKGVERPSSNGRWKTFRQRAWKTFPQSASTPKNQVFNTIWPRNRRRKVENDWKFACANLFEFCNEWKGQAIHFFNFLRFLIFLMIFLMDGFLSTPFTARSEILPKGHPDLWHIAI